MSIKKILTEYNLTDDIQHARKILASHDIILSEHLEYYVGSGAYGDVYKVKGVSKVIKFYDDSEEFKIYEKLVDQKGKMDHVITVFLNKKLTDSLYICVMEFLKESDVWGKTAEHVLVKNMENSYLKYKDNWKHMNTKSLLAKIDTETYADELDKIVVEYSDDITLLNLLLFLLWAMKKKFNDSEFRDTIKLITNEIKFFKEVFKGIQELEKAGVFHNDIHFGNVLIDPRSKKFKIIDPQG